MMKNKRKQKNNAKETKLSIVPGVCVIAGIMVAVFAVLFIIMGRSGNMSWYFGGFFSSSFGSSDKTDSPPGNIVIPSETSTVLSNDYFYTPDFTQAAQTQDGISSLLQTVRGNHRLEQTFLISYQSGPVKMVTVMRDGNKYRIEAPEVLVVCNGDIVYVSRTVDGTLSFENRWNVEEGSFSPENEIGIPSFDEIIRWVDESEMLPRMSFDEQKKIISLMGIVEDNLVKSVTLTYETGLVLSVSIDTFSGTNLLQCDSVFYTLDPAFTDDIFAIPMP